VLMSDDGAHTALGAHLIARSRTRTQVHASRVSTCRHQIASMKACN
jgi:hypothetical protein